MKKNSVQQRILDTASVLFYNQGFNNTGINQIIADANIAIGSLYKHYKSKNDLLYCYLEMQERVFFSNLDLYLKDMKDPKEKILKVIDYRIALQEDSNFSGCHFIKINAELGRKNGRVNELAALHKEKQRAYLFTIIEQTGKGPYQTAALASTIFLLLEGAVVSAAIQGNTKDLQALKEIIPQLI
ncbi:TetR/AcrR family transcriptional regulator [Flavobacterium sp. SORGH_AS_0622]|uniref:TetR/AcrR family transcriptional regulator n=1 Tax=Flavobacterium sp. SORGH_AS_0622 TaxID=3041772 RepID=UPI00278B4911|nr:TetR/AcrR family transcriptional regulator [Flavobacterium sp. SORGH_AS_0622]MDQ1165650.1 AcrR family transcriptional regulator [Flavobacterium sp. SORGH_AS_0622]